MTIFNDTKIPDKNKKFLYQAPTSNNSAYSWNDATSNLIDIYRYLPLINITGDQIHQTVSF